MPVTFVHCPACDFVKALLAYNKLSRRYFFCPRCQYMWDTSAKPHSTSYSRRSGDYVYDIDIHEIKPPANAARFSAHVVNMMRLEPGHVVSVDAELQDAYGAIPAEAVLQINVTLEAWVKDQARTH